MRSFLSLAFICTLGYGTSGLSAAEFISPEGLSAQSEDGTVELEWSQEAREAATFRIERAVSPSFTDALVVYAGPDTATFVSGLPEGMHYFRVREGADSWSDSVLALEVKFVSKTLVVILLTAGSLCLVLLVAALVQGQRMVKSERMNQSSHRSSNPLNSQP